MNKYITLLCCCALVVGVSKNQAFSQSLVEELQKSVVDDSSVIYKEDGVNINLEKEAIKGVSLDGDGDGATRTGDVALKKSKEMLQQEYYDSLPFQKIKALYSDSRYSDLTKLYWKMGLLDVDKDSDVYAYLLLTQCNRIKGVAHNDFKVRELTKAAREYLSKNKGRFNSKLFFMQAKKLANYNFASNAYNIERDFSYDNIRRLRITNNIFQYKDFCLEFPDVNEYVGRAPYNIVLSLPTSFSFSEVPMSPELSKTYLDYLKEEGRQKIVYTKFYASLNFHKNTVFDMNTSGGYLADFSGSIDYVEVFADREMRRLLYSYDYRNR